MLSPPPTLTASTSSTIDGDISSPAIPIADGVEAMLMSTIDDEELDPCACEIVKEEEFRLLVVDC
jgi:hypothetical protein